MCFSCICLSILHASVSGIFVLPLGVRAANCDRSTPWTLILTVLFSILCYSKPWNRYINNKAIAIHILTFAASPILALYTLKFYNQN